MCMKNRSRLIVVNLLPARFRNKMCGLCNDCGVNGFKLKNGTVVQPPKRGLKWDRRYMTPLAAEYTIYDENSKFAE